MEYGMWVEVLQRTGCKAGQIFKALRAISSGVVLGAAVMMAQTVPSGARIDVRTINRIDVHDADGRVFAGSVDQNVVDTRRIRHPIVSWARPAFGCTVVDVE